MEYIVDNLFPGGVNSPVRSFEYVKLEPITITYARGSKVYTVNGKIFTDYILSWGAAILGHNYKYVIAETNKALKRGLNYGLNNEYEVALGKIIKEAIPSIELMRFVNSGTEATMTAIRLARAYTGKKKIVKFNGAYHGHYDAFLAAAGSGLATHTIPVSKGVLGEIINNTLVVEFNDIQALKHLVAKEYENIAAIIMEPIIGNSGVILPEENFLKEVRKLTEQYGIVLIFDEIITGFRFIFGGFQNIVNVSPDLTCLGKIVGGGLPIGVVGGKKEIMELLAPIGEAYQAGTFSGNPVVCAAGKATLEILRQENIYDRIDELADFMKTELNGLDDIVFSNYGGMFSIFFLDTWPRSRKDLDFANTDKFVRFYRFLFESGILLPPSPFEAGFISYSHTKKEIELFIKKVKKFREVM